MPPTDRFVISFAAEPPQEGIPYGRWADTLAGHFLGACRELDTEGEDIGEPGDISWFPDRTYAGRTYIPAVARTSGSYELFGFVSFSEAAGGPSEFDAHADFTSELANLAVDQCELVDERFTLIAPDNYRSDYLEVKLWSRSGDELARESLYVDDEEE
jgi:hypothetical protein